MSEMGVFAVDRGVFDHPKLKEGAPFLKVNAWLWLLAAAAWKDHTRWISGRSIRLKRGQIVASTRYMAAQWHWSEARVRRFLDTMKIDADGGAEIEAHTDAGITIITILKYNDYQRVSLPRDAASDTPNQVETDAAATQQRRNIEDKEYKEEDIRAVAERHAPANPLRFEEFWAEYPRRDGANPKKPALKVYQQAVKSGQDEQAIIDGARRYRDDMRRRGQEGSPYVAQAQTWLRQSRWSDYPPIAQQTSSAPLDEPVRDWRVAMKFFTSTPSYARTWPWPGSRPGEPGCQVPEDILREFGFGPPVAIGDQASMFDEVAA